MVLKHNKIIQGNFDLDGQYFLIIKLINKFMQHGKKTTIERIFLQICIYIKNRWQYFPKNAFFWLFNNLKPILGLFAKRIGKKYYFIPGPLRSTRPIVLSLKWFVQNIKAKTIPWKLHDRIICEIAYIFFNSRHSIIQRRNAYYDIIYDNRSHMRYRWE